MSENHITIYILIAITLFCGAGAVFAAVLPSIAPGADSQHVGTLFNMLIFLFGTGVTTIFVLLGR